MIISFSQFEERGPYVYTEEARKIDDKFDTTNHQVSFKTFTKQTFDAKRTAELCQNCKENDTVMLIIMDLEDSQILQFGSHIFEVCARKKQQSLYGIHHIHPMRLE